MTDYKYTIKRVCPEHLCKIFNTKEILSKAERGEYLTAVVKNKIQHPTRDRKGNLASWTEWLHVTSNEHPVGDPRHEIALAHRRVSDEGVVCGSGKWDPKEMMLSDIKYEKFRTRRGREPHCELCEGGDMIHPLHRQHDSHYRPGERAWHKFLRTLIASFRSIIAAMK
jgi:hypothetical protein